MTLAGCQPCGWRCREAISDCAAFNSIQLKYPAANNFSGIEVELLKGSFGYLGFLNVYNREIPSPRVVIEIHDQFYEFYGKIMEGGQRLQLPPEALFLIVNTMQEKGELSIFLEGFATTLTPLNFKPI